MFLFGKEIVSVKETLEDGKERIAACIDVSAKDNQRQLIYKILLEK